MITFKPFETLKSDFTNIHAGTFFKIVNDDDPDKIYLQLTAVDYYDFDEEVICKSPKFYGHKAIPLDVDIHVGSLLEKQVKLNNFHDKYQDVRIFVPGKCIFTEEEKKNILSGKFFKTENDAIILSLTDTLYFDFNDCNVHNLSEITGKLDLLGAEIFYGARNEREVRTNE